MPQVEDEVRIADLEAQCSYLRFWPTTNTRQPCGQPATSLVQVPDAPLQGNPKYRCDDHKGMFNSHELGTVVETMSRALAKELLA